MTREDVICYVMISSMYRGLVFESNGITFERDSCAEAGAGVSLSSGRPIHGEFYVRCGIENFDCR